MKKIDLKAYERQIVFIVLTVAVVLAILFPLGLKTLETPLTRKVHDLVEQTPAAAPVIISFDYDPSTETELQPMAEAIIEHAWKKKHRVITTAMWPQGSQMAEMAFKNVMAKTGETKVYGEDFVNLGYKTGGLVVIQSMGRNMRNTFPKDSSGRKYQDIPLLQNVRTLKDIKYVISLSAGDPGLSDWVITAHDKFGVTVAGGTTAVSAPGFYPYVNEQRQLTGLMGGLKAAAEYERLMGYEGPATKNMNPQSVAHVLILIFIAIGNVRAWRKRHPAAARKEVNNV